MMLFVLFIAIMLDTCDGSIEPRSGGIYFYLSYL